MVGFFSRATGIKFFRQPAGVDATNFRNRLMTKAPTGEYNMVNSVFQTTGTYFQGGWAGVAAANNSMQMELPYYTPHRFRFAQNLNVQKGTHEDSSQMAKHEYHADLFARVAATGTTVNFIDYSYDRWVSVADDFSLFYFQNAPVFYTYTVPRPKYIPS